MANSKPIGNITRGTTNPNRLRRVDRYLANLEILTAVPNPVVVDLGFGKSPITAIELRDRLKKINPGVRVVGIEIDRERVAEAQVFTGPDLDFVHGGFEIPNAFSNRKDVDLIRAFNVLRQYSEAEVSAAWNLMCSRLSPSGLIVEGTCDEVGRYASWITLDKSGPQFFTISLRLPGLDKPGKVAERLPKILIHKNTPGHKIHDYLQDFDKAWDRSAGYAIFGSVQRFIKTCQLMREIGWPLRLEPKRWRLGEVSVSYAAISS